MAGQYELVARVGKARGLEGEVTAMPADGLPLCLRAGLRVHVVPPTLYGPRDITIARVRAGKGSGFVLAFEEVTTRDDAEQVAGRWLLADARDLEFDADEAVPATLIGLPVVDERYGELGTVTELIETPANDVLAVEGRYGEVLVPLIDQTVVSVPEQAADPLVTHIMDGLVDDGTVGAGAAGADAPGEEGEGETP